MINVSRLLQKVWEILFPGKDFIGYIGGSETLPAPLTRSQERVALDKLKAVMRA